MWLCVWLHVLRRGSALSSPFDVFPRLPLHLRQTQSRVLRAWLLVEYQHTRFVPSPSEHPGRMA